MQDGQNPSETEGLWKREGIPSKSKESLQKFGELFFSEQSFAYNWDFLKT